MRLIFLILMTTLFTTLKAQEPSNKHFWYSLETTAAANSIWALWVDVPNWKNWDIGLKDASFSEQFKAGNQGIIVSLEGRKAKFKVVEYIEGESYTYKTKLPLGSLFVKRYLKTENNVTTFTHEVWFKGLTSGLFAKALGKDFRKMLPEVLLNIKNIVEGNDSY